MHKGIEIPVGISDFEKIREENYYYVDKSGLISEMFQKGSPEVTLFTRPRRFGKTLAMSMLECFFDIRRDSRELFAGLEILKNRPICDRWMNQWPTIFLSFKRVEGLDFAGAYGMLELVISDLYKEHRYLLDSTRVDIYDKKVISRIIEKKASPEEIKDSLILLTRVMKMHYGRQVILLMDEYDVPVAKADSNGYYSEMLDMMKGLLQALKDNASLRFAVITGCLRIAKESIFTGTNNFTVDTISDNRYNEYFGFTHREVEQLLEDTGCSQEKERTREWYDGYHFGDMNIYCPWDVLNYVKKLLTEGVTVPENYWENTSDNAVIRQFLERTDFDVTEKFETLLDGGMIREVISENLTYDVLTATESNLWSLLYLTGYLTRAFPEEFDFGEGNAEKGIALKIPNAEVMDIFRKSVAEWFRNKSVHSDRREMFAALWKGEADKLTKILSDLLFDTISYHDYQESFYHAFITGLFSSAGYIVESNFENGLGRPDIVIKDRGNRQAAVIETKIADKEDQLEKECQKALKQIEGRQYARKLERSGFKTVLQYGAAFYRKECLIRIQEKE